MRPLHLNQPLHSLAGLTRSLQRSRHDTDPGVAITPTTVSKSLDHAFRRQRLHRSTAPARHRQPHLWIADIDLKRHALRIAVGPIHTAVRPPPALVEAMHLVDGGTCQPTANELDPFELDAAGTLRMQSATAVGHHPASKGTFYAVVYDQALAVPKPAGRVGRIGQANQSWAHGGSWRSPGVSLAWTRICLEPHRHRSLEEKASGGSWRWPQGRRVTSNASTIWHWSARQRAIR